LRRNALATERHLNRVEFDRLSRLFSDLLGLEISEGALVNILDDSKQAFARQASLIRAHLLASTILQSDETSVRVFHQTPAHHVWQATSVPNWDSNIVITHSRASESQFREMLRYLFAKCRDILRVQKGTFYDAALRDRRPVRPPW
jgi:hypothetical protein